MTNSILLVHSPLVGPSSWTASAELLRARGFDVRVPDLTLVAQAPPPRWSVFVDAAVAGAVALDGEVVIAGHSGAGAFLPAIAARLESRVAALFFVDAVIPPSSGAHETPAKMRALLDEQTVDGRLRRWLEWWPDNVVRDLVPVAEDRRALLKDMPSLPRSFYDEPIPVPQGWAEQWCAYVKLSEAYEAQLSEAARRGWTCIELDADHLAIRTRPGQVVEALLSLLNVLPSAPPSR